MISNNWNKSAEEKTKPLINGDVNECGVYCRKQGVVGFVLISNVL